MKTIIALKKLEKVYSSFWGIRHTIFGMCHAMQVIGITDFDSEVYESLRETAIQMLENKDLDPYWWKKGDRKPRLECIRRTLAKLDVKEEKLFVLRSLLHVYAKRFFFGGYKNATSLGMCYAASCTIKGMHISCVIDDIGEIARKMKGYTTQIEDSFDYYFEPGKVWPRLICTLKTIKKVKQE